MSKIKATALSLSYGTYAVPAPAMVFRLDLTQFMEDNSPVTLIPVYLIEFALFGVGFYYPTFSKVWFKPINEDWVEKDSDDYEIFIPEELKLSEYCTYVIQPAQKV